MPRAVRYLAVATLGVSLPAIAGCSTLVDLAGVPHAGLQVDGHYIASSEERALDCRKLTALVYRQIEQMQRIPERAMVEREAVPPTVAAVFSRTLGEPGNGLKAISEYDRTHARAVALNQVLTEKSCAPVDLEAPLSEADVIMSAVRGTGSPDL